MSRMNESCHMECVMRHVTYGWVMSHMNGACHIWMSHVRWVMDTTHFIGMTLQIKFQNVSSTRVTSMRLLCHTCPRNISYFFTYAYLMSHVPGPIWNCIWNLIWNFISWVFDMCDIDETSKSQMSRRQWKFIWNFTNQRVHTYTNIYTHTHIYTYVNICTHIHIYICIYIHIYVYAYAYVYVYVYLYICIYIRVCAHQIERLNIVMRHITRMNQSRTKWATSQPYTSHVAHTNAPCCIKTQKWATLHTQISHVA